MNFDEDDNDDLPPAMPISGRHAVHRRVSDHETKESDPETIVVSPDVLAVPSKARYPRIDGYKITGILGRGGMGVVYRAIDNKLNRDVAIKTMVAHLRTPKFQQRFETEAKSLALINHKGVTRVYDFGISEDTPYLVMDYIEGQTLNTIADGKPLESARAAEIVMQLADALHACHEQGIIHRDVKPANVIMTPKGVAKLTDFGIAKQRDDSDIRRLTSTGEIMGTPAYMAPEQASGVIKKVGPATDVYGAGAVLYELLTGRPPFLSHDPVQIVLMVLGNQPVAPRALQPHIPKDLENIVLKALEKKPADRYATGEQLAKDLGRFLRGEPVQARPVSVPRRAIFWMKQHSVITSVAALVVLAVASALVGLSIHNARLQTELNRTKYLVAKGRDLSEWLFNDFSRMIQEHEGSTTLLNQLTNTTKDYLIAMEAGVEGNADLRLNVVQSWIKLASIQGGPDLGVLGQHDQARTSLDTAEALLKGFESHPQYAKTKMLLWIYQAKLDLIHSNGVPAARERLAQISAMLADQNLNLTSQQRFNIEYETLLIELRISNAEGDAEASERVIARLEQLYSAQKDRDPDRPLPLSMLTLLWQARVNRATMEDRSGELIEPLSDDLHHVRTLLKKDMANLHTRSQIAILERLLADTTYLQGDYESALALYATIKATWEEAGIRDPENAGAFYNAGNASCYMAETLMTLDRMEEVKPVLDQAREFYTRYAARSGLQLNQCPEAYGIYGAEAMYYSKLGDRNRAIEILEQKAVGLQEIASANVEYRQQVADDYAQMVMLYVVTVVEELEFEGPEPPDSLYDTFDKALAAIDRAKSYFEALENDGVSNERVRGQQQRVLEMEAILKQERDRLEPVGDIL